MIHNQTFSYCNLGTIKAPNSLNIGDNTADDTLIMWAEAASNFINQYCHRYFYTYEGTKYFNGASQTLNLPEDVLSITTLSLDTDGSKTYGVSLSSTDYEKEPLNKFPTTYLKIANNASYTNFASGIRAGVRMTGVFGYGNGLSATPYIDVGLTATVGTTTGTTLTLSEDGILQIGHTLRAGTEQMYCVGVSSGNKSATVIRGINGTAAATHSTSEVYVYQYPAQIVGATLMQLSIWWERRKSAYASKVGNSMTGEYEIYRGLDPGVGTLLNTNMVRLAI